MKDYSIELFRENVNKDLNTLETSNLKKVNLKLYNELKEMFNNLDKNISLYETKLGNVTREDLGNEWATLSAIFDFYMTTTGTKEVINYQVGEIKENLEKIVCELNQDNYELISKKFNASLDLYNKILNIALKTQEINELINKFNYQILKYKIDDFILDDSHDFNIYIPNILNDIETILNNNEVSNNIKDSLRMYAIDKSFVLNNFTKVMRLIVLAETKKQVTDKELEKFLNSTIYKESDIEKEYHEPSKEMREKAYGTPMDLEKIFEYCKEDAKEVVPIAVLENIRLGSFNENKAVETLIKNNFKDIRYLFDALLSKDKIGWAIYIADTYKRRNIDTSYEFDCAIIAYRDTLTPKKLKQHIMKSNNEFLINYIINNKIDVFTDYFINYIVDSNNPKLKKYLEDNILSIPLNEVINSKLDNELKKQAIKKAIIVNVADKEELFDVFNFFDKITDEDLIKYITEIIISLQDIEILWEYAIRLNGNLGDNITKILNQIPESDFKNKLLDILYDTNHGYGKMLIDNNEGRKWQQYSDTTFHIDGAWIEGLNFFEASYVSGKLTQEYHLIEFVKLYYKARLNWQHLYELSKKLSEKEQEEFYKYFYLGNKELFFNTVKNIDHNFALAMINEFPESVVDFLKYLFGSEIVELPKSTLDIFVKYYEEKISKDNISLTDLMHNTLSQTNYYYNEASDQVELLTYIMCTGIINNEILMYAKTMTFADSLNPLFIKAIHNTKTPYLRASFASKIKLYGGDWNIIFLTEKEKEDIINSEDNVDTKDLKFRKYYGDLLKLLPSTPDNIKYRIVTLIAKSKIEEYINYIVINYPELADILLENIEDHNLYQKIMEISLKETRK